MLRALSAVASLAAVMSPAHAQTFVDRTADFGLTIGNGPAAWGDINNDGRPDLYAGGAVWINNNAASFSRVDAPGRGIIADLNNDGLGDLVSFAPIAIFITRLEDGVCKFDPLPLPELPETHSRGAAVADLNNDGFLDIYFGGYERWDPQTTYPDLLLTSQGGQAFALTVVSRDYRARGVTACDYDEDGDVDLYVSNYRLMPNLLWTNDGHANLTDRAADRNAVATSTGFGGGHSIGACWADFDADGHIDLLAGNFAHVDSRGDQPKSRFLRNRGPDHDWAFEDLAECGVWYQESYASPAAADFDNDTRLDLFFTTVYADASFGKKNHPVLYRNESTDPAWVFKDVTEGSGLEKLPPTYQAAWADVDADGRIDLVTAGRLFINQTDPDAHWLQLRLLGDGEEINTQAVGAQARITLPDGRTLTRQVEIGTGEGNANSPILHFGLADHAEPVTLTIHWPDGTVTTTPDLPIDQRHTAIFTPTTKPND